MAMYLSSQVCWLRRPSLRGETVAPRNVLNAAVLQPQVVHGTIDLGNLSGSRSANRILCLAASAACNSRGHQPSSCQQPAPNDRIPALISQGSA